MAVNMIEKEYEEDRIKIQGIHLSAQTLDLY